MTVIDKWTTQEGSWDVDDSHPYGIDLEHQVKYGNEDIPGKGGSTHIFVKAPAKSVTFRTADGLNDTEVWQSSSGWTNFPMFHSSAYNPDKGERGPWEVWVDGTKVVDGIGLPFGWHVSTFLVVGESGTSTGPTVPPSSSDVYQLFKNGVLVWRS